MVNINRRKAGFTLIELLVVIAIIGILSSVVLASLNTARDKGSDAAAKASLNNARAQAELYYDSGSTYTGVCGTGTNSIDALITSAENATSKTVNCAVNTDSGGGWAAAADLKSQVGWYCVDYTGNATTTSSATSPIGTTEASGADVSCN